MGDTISGVGKAILDCYRKLKLNNVARVFCGCDNATKGLGKLK